MSRSTRWILAGALCLIFVGSGCGIIERPEPTPVWTIPAGDVPGMLTSTAAATYATVAPVTSTSISVTSVLPNTGGNFVSMQCQFCVGEEAHVMLTFPDFTTFDVVSSSPVTCLTAEVVNDQRIVICRGDRSTTFNLKVCSDTFSCLEFPVTLRPCPPMLAGATPLATSTRILPTAPAPTRTPKPPAATAVPSVTATPESEPVTPTSPPPSYP